MGIKEEVNDVKEEIEEMSFAMEMLKFSKQQAEINNRNLAFANKRLVIIIIIILVLWGGTIGGFFYYVTHYGYEDTIETSQEVDDIDTIENSYIINGGDYNGEGKTNTKTYKEES